MFNTRTKTLAGMAVRAGFNRERAILRYIDIFDIMKVLESVHNGQGRTSYTKIVTVLQTEPANPGTG